MTTPGNRDTGYRQEEQSRYLAEEAHTASSGEIIAAYRNPLAEPENAYLDRQALEIHAADHQDGDALQMRALAFAMDLSRHQEEEIQQGAQLCQWPERQEAMDTLATDSLNLARHMAYHAIMEGNPELLDHARSVMDQAVDGHRRDMRATQGERTSLDFTPVPQPAGQGGEQEGRQRLAYIDSLRRKCNPQGQFPDEEAARFLGDSVAARDLRQLHSQNEENLAAIPDRDLKEALLRLNRRLYGQDPQAPNSNLKTGLEECLAAGTPEEAEARYRRAGRFNRDIQELAGRAVGRPPATAEAQRQATSLEQAMEALQRNDTAATLSHIGAMRRELEDQLQEQKAGELRETLAAAAAAQLNRAAINILQEAANPHEQEDLKIDTAVILREAAAAAQAVATPALWT